MRGGNGRGREKHCWPRHRWTAYWSTATQGADRVPSEVRRPPPESRLVCAAVRGQAFYPDRALSGSPSHETKAEEPHEPPRGEMSCATEERLGRLLQPLWGAQTSKRATGDLYRRERTCARAKSRAHRNVSCSVPAGACPHPPFERTSAGDTIALGDLVRTTLSPGARWRTQRWRAGRPPRYRGAPFHGRHDQR